MGLDHVLHQRDQILWLYIVPLAPGCDPNKFACCVMVAVGHSANNRSQRYSFNSPKSKSNFFCLAKLKHSNCLRSILWFYRRYIYIYTHISLHTLSKTRGTRSSRRSRSDLRQRRGKAAPSSRAASRMPARQIAKLCTQLFQRRNTLELRLSHVKSLTAHAREPREWSRSNLRRVQTEN